MKKRDDKDKMNKICANIDCINKSKKENGLLEGKIIFYYCDECVDEQAEYLITLQNP